MDLAWTDVTAAVMDRVSGPLRFRLILQPAMAAFFAVRAGLADVRDGKSAYFSMLVRDASDRRELADEAWKDIGRVFVLAVVMDGIYQYMVAGWIHPGEAVLAATVLAVVPYLVLRGPVARIVRRTSRKDIPS